MLQISRWISPSYIFKNILDSFLFICIILIIRRLLKKLLRFRILQNHNLIFCFSFGPYRFVFYFLFKTRTFIFNWFHLNTNFFILILEISKLFYIYCCYGDKLRMSFSKRRFLFFSYT